MATLTAAAAAADFIKRVREYAKRVDCLPTVAWAALVRCPWLLTRSGVRPVSRIPPPAAPRSKRTEPGVARTCVASTCVACLEPLLPPPQKYKQRKAHREDLAFVPCGHAMHAACGDALIDSYVDQGKPMPFACPCQPCRGVLASPTRVPFRPSFLPRAYAPCPGPDCDRFVLSVRTGAHAVRCNGCNTRFCHACRGKPHEARLPCAALLAHAAVAERIDAATAALNAVSITALALQMADQYTQDDPDWMFIERLLLFNPVPAGPPAAAVPQLRMLPIADLIATARGEVAISEAPAAPPPPPTVLDDAIAAILPADSGGGWIGIEEQSKFCPRCFVRIVRSEGCPSMQCRCGMRFCYDCLGPAHTHDKCTHAVDVEALRSAARKAGVDDATVDGLALFTDEHEVFRNWFGRYRVDPGVLTTVRRARLARLVPLIQATERIAALTERGVSAPPGMIEDARVGVCVELEKGRQVIASQNSHLVKRRAERATKLARLATSTEIQTYAKKRVDTAMALARRRIVPPGMASAIAWHTSVRAHLERARALGRDIRPEEWLAPRHVPPTPPATLVLDGTAIRVIGESQDGLRLRVAAIDGTPHYMAKPTQAASLQPGQFDADDIKHATWAMRELLKRVLDAAEEAALTLAHAPAGRRPVVAPAAAAAAAINVGDVVGRGPVWMRENNHGIVTALPGGDIVQVRWPANGWMQDHYRIGEIIPAPDWNVPCKWTSVRGPLLALAPHLSPWARRALARLDAALDVTRPGPKERRATWSPAAVANTWSIENDAIIATANPLPDATAGALRPDACVVRAVQAVHRTHIAPPPPPAKLATTTGWSCPACTYFNSDGHRRQCEVCETPRRAAEAPVPVHASSVPGNAALARLTRALHMW